MDNFFQHDPRITDPALRDLEKKLHYVIASLGLNVMLYDGSSNVPNLPNNEVVADAIEVSNTLPEQN